MLSYSIYAQFFQEEKRQKRGNVDKVYLLENLQDKTVGTDPPLMDGGNLKAGFCG